MNDFYNKPTEETTDDTEETVEKTKVGDKEYTQDELNVLVGLGEFAQKVQTEQNRPLDRIYPEYIKTTQRLTELEKENDSLKSVKTNTKIEEGVDLTPAEKKEQIRKELREYGAVLSEDVDSYIDRRLGARDTLATTKGVIADAKEKYGINTNEDELLNFMGAEGIRSPETAFKLKYEDQIDERKEKQIEKAKKPGMATESTSTAGSKAPQAVRPTYDNADALMDDIFNRNQ